MRILIVLAIVCGLGYWVYSMSQTGFNASFITGGMNKLTGVGNTMLKGPKSAQSPESATIIDSSGPFKAGTLSAPSRDTESPKASRIYHFERREPPSLLDLAFGSSVGCVFSVDHVTRSVLVAGPVDGVEICYRYLESIDVVSGACSVQSWAVYVDKSAQKGFDFISAIAAATRATSSVHLGSGGMTLNVGAPDISAALSVICDGSVVDVVQRPYVQLTHSIPATIESIEEVPIPTTSVSQGISQTSVTYRKVGLQLSITPYFMGENQLRLSVAQTNGLLGQKIKIGENEVPIIQSQTVSSSVSMRVGQTVILGGVSTLKKRTVKGIFRSTDEISEGYLYVILSTYFDEAKTLEIDHNPVTKSKGQNVPLGPPPADPSDWIYDEISPSLSRDLFPDTRKNKISEKNEMIPKSVLPEKKSIFRSTFRK